MAILKRGCVMQDYWLPVYYSVPSWLPWFTVKWPFTSQSMHLSIIQWGGKIISKHYWLKATKSRLPPFRSSFCAGLWTFLWSEWPLLTSDWDEPGSRGTQHGKALPKPDGTMCGGAAAFQSNEMWLQFAVTTASPVGLSGQRASAGKITGDQYRFFHLTIFSSLSRMLYHLRAPAYLAQLMISSKWRHRYWPLAFLLLSGKNKIGRWFFFLFLFLGQLRFFPSPQTARVNSLTRKANSYVCLCKCSTMDGTLRLKLPNNTQTVWSEHTKGPSCFVLALRGVVYLFVSALICLILFLHPRFHIPSPLPSS